MLRRDWRQRVPAGPVLDVGHAAGSAEPAGLVCAQLAPSQGNLGWGMALREGSCLARKDINAGCVQRCRGVSLPASAVAAFLLLSFTLQKSQCFLLILLFLFFFKCFFFKEC